MFDFNFINKIKFFFDLDEKKNYQKESAFNLFPKEIQIEIFKQLSGQEFAMITSLVCKEWKNLGEDNSLWRIFYEKVSHIPIEELREIKIPCFDNNKLNYQYAKAIHQQENLLGKMICKHIELLPIWPYPETINKGFGEEDGLTVPMQFGVIKNLTYQYNQWMEKFSPAINSVSESIDKFKGVQENLFFKAIVGKKLLVIFINKNKINSEIFVFNNSADFSKLFQKINNNELNGDAEIWRSKIKVMPEDPKRNLITQVMLRGCLDAESLNYFKNSFKSSCKNTQKELSKLFSITHEEFEPN